MEQVFQFVSPWLGITAILAIIITVFLRMFWHKSPALLYSLSSRLQKEHVTARAGMRHILTLMRMLTCLLLALLIARPQWVDMNRPLIVEGVDIMLVMDISGSMEYVQDSKDQRSRLDIAKKEAINFINNRVYDAIGLVFFANDIMARCPLTLDKQILQSCMEELQINYLPKEGTLLCSGMLMAANRLKNSTAKSRIMIVLTDGEPTEGDQDPRVVLEIAKELGIKIYTIGIGSEKPLYVAHPLYGYLAIPGVNKELLTMLSQQTGGEFFLACSAQDMRTIYQKIDQLEKSELPVPIPMKYYELLFPLLWVVILVLIAEIGFATFVWYGL